MNKWKKLQQGSLYFDSLYADWPSNANMTEQNIRICGLTVDGTEINMYSHILSDVSCYLWASHMQNIFNSHTKSVLYVIIRKKRSLCLALCTQNINIPDAIRVSGENIQLLQHYDIQKGGNHGPNQQK
jgi:hypothetical protein